MFDRAKRKRKTKDPCPGCFMHKALCICALIPSLQTKTRVTLVVHAKELKRTTNTGRLAVQALTNSEMRIRGGDCEALDLSDLIRDDYETVLFYPSEDAVELNADFLSKINRPVHLIVPDGNWRQASKVQSRHPELGQITRVKIGTENLSTHHLRAETTKEGMATLQAIAQALGILESVEIKTRLMALYSAKLERTMLGRGTVSAI